MPVEVEPNIDKAWQWAVNTCNAPNVGYSMNTDERNGKTVNGITYYDCSSFVFFALKAGGFDMGQTSAFGTPGMQTWLPNHGFHQVDPEGEWKAGDILLDPDAGASGHTEMVYQGGVGRGITMGAHQAGVKLEDQVSINNGETVYYAGWRYYGGLWRYGEGGSGQGVGVSIYVISAILGNWYHESGINPDRYEGGREIDLFDPNIYGGYGFGQWTDSPDSGLHRRHDLVVWLRDNGYETYDPYGQLRYFVEVPEWIPKYPYTDTFPDLDTFLNSKSTDIDMLCDAYYVCWEAAETGSTGIRQYYAHRVYEYLREHGNDTGLEWVIGNFSATDAQRLNNAVLVYQWLSVAGGGGGGGHNYSKPMPVWMMIRRWF